MSLFIAPTCDSVRKYRLLNRRRRIRATQRKRVHGPGAVLRLPPLGPLALNIGAVSNQRALRIHGQRDRNFRNLLTCSAATTSVATADRQARTPRFEPAAPGGR